MWLSVFTAAALCGSPHPTSTIKHWGSILPNGFTVNGTIWMTRAATDQETKIWHLLARVTREWQGAHHIPLDGAQAEKVEVAG